MPAVSPISGERRGTLRGWWKNDLFSVVCSYWISHITKSTTTRITTLLTKAARYSLGAFTVYGLSRSICGEAVKLRRGQSYVHRIAAQFGRTRNQT